MKRETVLVTGARGTVGSYVVALAEAAGYRVIASDVTAAGVAVPVRGEVRPADLRHPQAAAELVRGCWAVIHTAAELNPSATAAELTDINTDAVVRLYRASGEAGVERFVHLSSATLYAQGHGAGEVCSEHTSVAPTGPYGMSRHAAELFITGQNGPKPTWTVVRAAPIYGRRGRHYAASLLAIGPVLRLLSPRLPRLSGGPKGSMAHAEDVARALVFLLDKDAAEGAVFNVADDDWMPLGERLSVTFDAYGLPTLGKVPLGELPLGMLALGQRHRVADRAGDAALMAAWRVVRMQHRLKTALRPRLSRESFGFVRGNLVVDATKLRRLGWRPRFSSFERGWYEVLRWYQAEQWVPRYG